MTLDTVYTELKNRLKNESSSDEEFYKWQEALTLHFEGNIFEYELPKKLRKVLKKWESDCINEV